MCNKRCKDELEISFRFFFQAFWKCPNLHNFHRAFDQVEAGFKLSYFSQKRSFAGTFEYCF